MGVDVDKAGNSDVRAKEWIAGAVQDVCVLDEVVEHAFHPERG